VGDLDGVDSGWIVPLSATLVKMPGTCPLHDKPSPFNNVVLSLSI
jgi:hypothetical protein